MSAAATGVAGGSVGLALLAAAIDTHARTAASRLMQAATFGR